MYNKPTSGQLGSTPTEGRELRAPAFRLTVLQKKTLQAQWTRLDGRASSIAARDGWVA